MKSWCVWSMLLLAGAGHASTILLTGESLTFTVSDRSFASNSLRFGGPAAPTGVAFAFVTAPVSGSTQLEASLQSADGSILLDLPGDLSFQTGSFQGTYYDGAASVLSGRWILPVALSQQLFAGSQAVLVLRNDGPAIEVGLGAYSLAQELQVSLSGGDFSVGALSLNAGRNSAGPAPVPEPPSGALCGGVGVLFLLVGGGLKRFRRSRIE